MVSKMWLQWMMDSFICIAGYVCAQLAFVSGAEDCTCMALVVHMSLHHEQTSTNQLSNSDDRGWPVKKMQQVGSTRIRRERRPGDPFQMSKFTSSHHISDGPGVRTPKVLRRTGDRLRTASTQVWHHHPLICLITLLSQPTTLLESNDRQTQSAKVPRYVFPGK